MRIDQGAEHAPDSAAAIDRTPARHRATTRLSEWRSPKVIEKSCAALDGLPHSISEISN
jgi:hypothetical protein